MSFRTTGQIYAIGDIHGDYDALVSSLFIANVISKDHQWIGDNAIVVIIGDFSEEHRATSLGFFDHRNQARIVKLLNLLNIQAQRQSGKVLTLIGNHEFSLVGDILLPLNMFATVRINDNLFVHGGITETTFNEIKKITGKLTVNVFIKLANTILAKIITNLPLTSVEESINAILFGRQSGTSTNILWDRTMSTHSQAVDCPSPLRLFDDITENAVWRIILGHTIQAARGTVAVTSDGGYFPGFFPGEIKEHPERWELYGQGKQFPDRIPGSSAFPHGINYTCPFKSGDDGSVWRIDIGVSRILDVIPKESKFDNILAARVPQVLCFDEDNRPHIYISKQPLSRQWIRMDEQTALLDEYIDSIRKLGYV
jgi:hypothetical protein